MRIVKTKEELIKNIEEQLCFLDNYFLQYDIYEDFSQIKPMASCIGIIIEFVEKEYLKSELPKSTPFYDTCKEYIDSIDRISPFEGLYGFSFSGNGVSSSPFLDRSNLSKKIPFEAWCSNIIWDNGSARFLESNFKDKNSIDNFWNMIKMDLSLSINSTNNLSYKMEDVLNHFLLQPWIYDEYKKKTK